MKETKTYTAADMERYHSGQLTAAEMHAVEKAAMDDPFLADALEGYANAKTAATDLQSLQQKLTDRVAEKTERKIFALSNNWLKVAALLVLLAGGGWLVITTMNAPSKEDMAVTTEKETAPVQSSTYKMPDSVLKVQPSQNDNAVALQSESVSGQKTGRDLQAPTTAPGYMKDKVTDDAAANRPEENRTLFSPPAAESLKADSFSDAFARDMSKPAIRRAAPNDTIKNFDVVMKSTEVAPDEVVVVGKSRQRSNTSYKKIVVDTLEPAQGWSNFDDYIAGNIKSPEQLKMKPVNGEVELSFDVNKEGEPVNITITKSLCEKCDEEAVRLLKEGPKWTKKKKKGKVKIKF